MVQILKSILGYRSKAEPPIVTVAAAVPFRPYHAVALRPEQIREALAGQGQAMPVAALVQLLEGQIGLAVDEMARGVAGATGAYRMLREFYDGLTGMLDAANDAKK